MLLSDWKRVVAYLEGILLRVTSEEVITVSLTVNDDPTSVPSIAGIIEALKFVFSLLKWAVFCWLLTEMASIADLFAFDSLGLIGQTSDFPSNFLWVVIESGNDWMW